MFFGYFEFFKRARMISVSSLCGLISDRRLADHFGGKLHLGYMQIREKLADLKVITAC